MIRTTKLSTPVITAFLVAVYAVSAAFAQVASSNPSSIAFRKYPANGKMLCSPARNATVTREQMEMLFLNKECTDESVPQIDWESESAVSYYVQGDCDLTVLVDVLKDETEKRFTVAIVQKPGDCRVAGWKAGWIVFGRIPEGYLVEFSVSSIEDAETNRSTIEEVETRPTLKRRRAVRPAKAVEIDVGDCIPIASGGTLLIRTREELDAAVRSDSSRGLCLDSLRHVSFDNSSLLGVSIESGYCGVPEDLSFETNTRFFEARIISLDVVISYKDPGNLRCPVNSPSQFWLLGPKIDEEAEVGFNILTQKATRRD